eukprot:c41703_g1_i1 orf=2-256(-)
MAIANYFHYWVLPGKMCRLMRRALRQLVLEGALLWRVVWTQALLPLCVAKLRVLLFRQPKQLPLYRTRPGDSGYLRSLSRPFPPP